MALASILGSGMACKRRVDPPPPTPVRILSGSYALADVVHQASRQYVVPVWLSESQQPYEGLAPDAKLTERVGEADLIVMGSAIESRFIDVESRLISADRVLRLPIPEKSDWPTNAALWMDPQIVRSILPDLADRLARRRPRLEAHFREGVSRIDQSLGALLDELQTTSETIQSSAILTLDTRPWPLLARLGARWSYLPVDTARPLGVEEIAQVRSAARDREASVLVLPADLPGAMRESIGQRARMRAVAIDVLGRPGTDYFSILRNGLRALIEAAASG